MRSSAPESLDNTLFALAYNNKTATQSQVGEIEKEWIPISECAEKDGRLNRLYYSPESKKYKADGNCALQRICAQVIMAKHEYLISQGKIEGDGPRLHYTEDITKF